MGDPIPHRKVAFQGQIIPLAVYKALNLDNVGTPIGVPTSSLRQVKLPILRVRTPTIWTLGC